MRIAITSQNRHSITEHAGKCRKFWIYDVREQRVTTKQLVELPGGQSLHAQKKRSTDGTIGHQRAD